MPDRKYISCFAACSCWERALKIRYMSTNNEMRKILRDSASVKALAEAFGVTTRMVNMALNGEFRSDLVKRIRQRALDMGLKEKGKEQVTVLK